MQLYLSGAAFACLVVLIGGRSLFLYKKGIRAIVFGRTDKSDFLLLPVVMFLAYSLISGIAGLPMWPPLVRPFWSTTAPGWAGLVLCAIAVSGIAYGLKSFRDSFRVGIDESKPDTLITSGAFAISRNPLYVCFILFVLGQFLIHRNIIIAGALVLVPIAIHRQILREEVFLKDHYGVAFEEYCKKVRRYL